MNCLVDVDGFKRFVHELLTPESTIKDTNKLFLQRKLILDLHVLTFQRQCS